MEEKDYAKEYGLRCKQIRMAKGISQQALADLMHVTPQAVSKWEKDGIANVNTVQQLSNVLGQDITADQIDQEGAVGEIGREILSILVSETGYIDFSDLVDRLYGMSDDRVARELFKLERIGLIVREQFHDYLGNERDGIIITAKGLIAYKNSKEFPDFNSISETVTLDMKLNSETHTIQEVIDSDEVSKILWQIGDADGYMIDYIYYLKRKYQSNFTMGEDISLMNALSYFGENTVLGENCFVDTINKMVSGLSEHWYYDMCCLDYMDEYEYDRESELNELLNIGLDMDHESFYAQKFLSKIYDELEDFEDSLVKGKIHPVKDDSESKSALGEFIYEEYWSEEFAYTDRNKLFFNNIDPDKKNNCLRWFTKDEVIAHFDKSSSFDEHNREQYGEMLERIWELKPESLEYFYHFPKEWEENGLAKFIRERYGITDEIGAKYKSII